MLRKIYNNSPIWIKNLFLEAFRKTGQIALVTKKNKFIESSCLSKDITLSYNRQRMYGPRKYLCYAPFTSMFFSRNGNMSPCYASYEYKSDNWPKKSIHESWFNGEFKAIRDAMKSGNLDYACKFCKPLFESGNFGSLLPNKYEPYGIGKLQYPKIMEFELSNRCNLECVMCDGNLSSAIRKNRDKLPQFEEKYNDDFVQELEAFIPHLQMAEFTGGDPFLIPIYYDIWERIKTTNPDCQILITTNANTMSERIEKMLRTYRNLHFNISLDSLNKSNYTQIRRNAEFENVIANTKRFIAYCKKHKTSCNILVCPLTINSKDLKAVIQFANQNDICVYFHTVIKPKNLSLKFQTTEYLHNLITFLKEYTPPEETTNQRTNADNYHSLIHLLETWEENALQNKNLEASTLNKAVVLTELNQTLSIKARQRMLELTNAYSEAFENEALLIKLQKIDRQELEHILINANEAEINSLLKEYGEQIG
jgi:MoaA/NifB/PqqE/SkfB family radical SAM enzyme